MSNSNILRAESFMTAFLTGSIALKVAPLKYFQNKRLKEYLQNFRQNEKFRSEKSQKNCKP